MEKPVPQHTQMRQVGLLDLFTMIVFIMPIYATIAEVKRAGCGILAYVVALPLTVAIGALIVWVDWKLGKAVWIRSKGHSEKIKNAAGFALLAFQMFWIFVGLASGVRLAAFLVNHLAR
jgi:hypothetical protein